MSIARLLETYKERKSENGLAFYRPHRKQEWFHSLGSVKFRYVRTGNRFGKSDMGAAEDVAFAIGERLWLPERDPNRFIGIPTHSTKGLLICSDWQKAEEIFTSEAPGTSQGKLFKFIPKDRLVKIDRNHGGKIYKITVKNRWEGNSTIYIDTVAAFKQNEQKSESSAWDWIHVDEPIPKEMWTAVSRGLIDRNGSAWFACTPIMYPWINRFFLPQVRQKLNPDEIHRNGTTKAVIVGSSRDNPYTSREGLDSFFSGLTEAERLAREEGLPLEQTGTIYEVPDELLYDTAPPGWEGPQTPPKDWTLHVSLDPHPQTPHAALIGATGPGGITYFFEEIWEAGDIPTLADELHRILDPYFVLPMIADPSAWIEYKRDGTSYASDLAETGLYFERGPKDPRRAITLTRQALKDKRYRFYSGLTNTLMEFDSYVWDPKKPDKPRDKDDHFMECLGRLSIVGVHYIPQDEDKQFVRIPFVTAA